MGNETRKLSYLIRIIKSNDQIGLGFVGGTWVPIKFALLDPLAFQTILWIGLDPIKIFFLTLSQIKQLTIHESKEISRREIDKTQKWIIVVLPSAGICLLPRSTWISIHYPLPWFQDTSKPLLSLLSIFTQEIGFLCPHYWPTANWASHQLLHLEIPYRMRSQFISSQ